VIQSQLVVPVHSGMFSEYSSELTRTYSEEPLYEPDAIEFITGASYCNEEPTPFHRIALKTLYGLWDKRPPDKEEQAIIDIMREKWQTPIKNLLDPSIGRINTLILPVGRRGRKSALTVYIATFEAYKLICKFNPQKFYKIRPRHTIHIIHSAVSGGQAQEVFALARDLIKRAECFRGYIDFDKDNESELRLYTPHDKLENEQIKQRNDQIPRGQGLQKEPPLPGTIYVESITTSSRSSRGGSIIALLMTEFAHLERAKRTPQGESLTDNPGSDYAVYTALRPSTKDFPGHYVEVLESSPQEKGGEMYHQYCLAGGMEQDAQPGQGRFEGLPGRQVIQLASWEASPVMNEADLQDDKMSDPIGFEREFGGHFGNPSAQAIPEGMMNKAIVPDKWLVRFNTGRWTYQIGIDPGGKSKVKIGDTYAIAWAHKEDKPDGRKKYVIDGMHGFRETIQATHDGNVVIVPVDPNNVMQFVLELVRDLGGNNWVNEITFDQFESSQPIHFLQSLGIPAIETTFTNPYKAKMYGAFLGMLNTEQVELYEFDEDNWIGVLRQEMKYLQRRQTGGITFYAHPDTGPVQTDDFADVVANCVYRMHITDNPTQQNLREAVRAGQGPIRLAQSFTPQKGRPLWSGPNQQGAQSRPGGPNNIEERFRRR